MVVDFLVAPDGSIASGTIYRAVVHNRAQLTYNGVGPWLEGRAAAPPRVAASADLQAQLKLQAEAAQALREQGIGGVRVASPAPFPVVHNVGDMLLGHRRLMSLGESPRHVVPGHDPLVMNRYPRHGRPADEIVALHMEPNE